MRDTVPSTVGPVLRPLTPVERALCVRLGLEIGFDDDDESKHQFRHICWPYAAYEGPLCRSQRLWFHGGRFSSRPSLTTNEDVDCVGCLTRLAQVGELDPVLLDVIGRLAEAVDTLTGVETAASGLLDAIAPTPEYAAAVAAGHPETTPATLRQALEADQARHAKYATAYAKRATEGDKVRR